MTDDMVTWLRAQLDADEADARYNEDLSVDAGYSPRRVLAEVDAKRRILDMVQRWIDAGYPTMDAALRLLALPYAGRPGYQEEWKP